MAIKAPWSRWILVQKQRLKNRKRDMLKIGTLRSFAKERVLVMSVVMNSKIVSVRPLAPGRSAINKPTRISSYQWYRKSSLPSREARRSTKSKVLGISYSRMIIDMGHTTYRPDHSPSRVEGQILYPRAITSGLCCILKKHPGYDGRINAT